MGNSDDNNNDSDGFEVATTNRKNSNNNAKNKRVYIGNLPKNLGSTQELQDALTTWLTDQIPNLSIGSVQVNVRGKNPHALVDCGSQANVVIRKLHQQTWQGQRLVVQREKRNNNNNNNNQNKKSQGFSSSWSTPSVPQHSHDTQQLREFTPISSSQAALDIEQAVTEELSNAVHSGDDPLNVAIASTAAATLLAAMNAISLDEDNTVVKDDPTKLNHVNDAQEQRGDGLQMPLDDNYDENDDDYIKEEPTSFQLKPMADLLADFGQADPNWKNLYVDTSLQQQGQQKDQGTTNRLGFKGKAPIHICFQSFGFSRGAPKRMAGWSHSQPLLPLDCRDCPTVPGYLAWRDGLSGEVKRAFQYQKLQEGQPSLQDFARETVASQTWVALKEAQQAGHGYASPLEMTIHVGSESGRHRSVVACEWAATELRKMLRTNVNDVILQPVSVGTMHRDVELQRQQQQQQRNRKGDDASSGTRKKKDMGFAGDW